MRDWLALAGFLIVCAVVSSAGGAVTATSVGTWYQDLTKPAFTPPGGVFPPVWTTLFVLMALAAWRVWRRAGWTGARVALGLWGVQLAFNLGWSVIFFGLRSPGWASIEIVVLVAAIAATTVAFRRHDGWAAALMLPYLAWVGFAAVLTATIWHLN